MSDAKNTNNKYYLRGYDNGYLQGFKAGLLEGAKNAETEIIKSVYPKYIGDDNDNRE